MDINMQRAHNRDAVFNERFYFRRSSPADGEDTVAELTANEIINGSAEFIGLVPIVQMYLDSISVEENVRRQIERYILFVRGRANGSIMTAAAWIRIFVRNHPAYKFDSVVS
ncbi:glutamate--cysteine ligase, partial [Coemansia sp. RSA 1797]